MKDRSILGQILQTQASGLRKKKVKSEKDGQKFDAEALKAALASQVQEDLIGSGRPQTIPHPTAEEQAASERLAAGIGGWKIGLGGEDQGPLPPPRGAITSVMLGGGSLVPSAPATDFAAEERQRSLMRPDIPEAGRTVGAFGEKIPGLILQGAAESIGPQLKAASAPFKAMNFLSGGAASSTGSLLQQGAKAAFGESSTRSQSEAPPPRPPVEPTTTMRSDPGEPRAEKTGASEMASIDDQLADARRTTAFHEALGNVGRVQTADHILSGAAPQPAFVDSVGRGKISDLIAASEQPGVLAKAQAAGRKENFQLTQAFAAKPEVKDAQTTLSAAKNALESLDLNTAVGDANVVFQLVRAAEGGGRPSDKDVAMFKRRGGIDGWMDWAQGILNSGKMSSAHRREVRGFLNRRAKGANADMKSHRTAFAESLVNSGYSPEHAARVLGGRFRE